MGDGRTRKGQVALRRSAAANGLLRARAQAPRLAEDVLRRADRPLRRHPDRRPARDPDLEHRALAELRILQALEKRQRALALLDLELLLAQRAALALALAGKPDPVALLDRLHVEQGELGPAGG